MFTLLFILRVYVLELSRNDHICLIKLTLKNLLSDTDDGEYECRMTSSDERTSMSRKLKLVVISNTVLCQTVVLSVTSVSVT